MQAVNLVLDHFDKLLLATFSVFHNASRGDLASSQRLLNLLPKLFNSTGQDRLEYLGGSQLGYAASKKKCTAGYSTLSGIEISGANFSTAPSETLIRIPDSVLCLDDGLWLQHTKLK